MELGLPRRALTAALGELAEDTLGRPRHVTAIVLGPALRGLHAYHDALEAERRGAGRHTPTQPMLAAAYNAARRAAWTARDEALLTVACPRFARELAG